MRVFRLSPLFGHRFSSTMVPGAAVPFLLLLLLLGALSYAASSLPDPEAVEDFHMDHPTILSFGFPDALISGTTERYDFLDPVLIPDRDITLNLYTKKNEDKAYILEVGNTENLNSSPFNAEWPTKVIIHGWRSNIDDFNIFLRNYLSAGSYNVIAVDWSPVAQKEYFLASRLVRQVGKYVGNLLEFFQLQTNLSLADVHILGHSLGAHVGGFTGYSLSGKIGRITGMDPARPAFETPVLQQPKYRLDPTDAKFVDVIHTCAGTFGFVSPIGHVDFYPNGGTFTQPGCSVVNSQSCSHSRSYLLMAESIIRPYGFLAIECYNWMDLTSIRCSSDAKKVFMGEYVDENTRGTFYLRTNARTPFGQNVNTTDVMFHQLKNTNIT